jgi:hypothetical protein
MVMAAEAATAEAAVKIREAKSVRLRVVLMTVVVWLIWDFLLRAQFSPNLRSREEKFHFHS